VKKKNNIFGYLLGLALYPLPLMEIWIIMVHHRAVVLVLGEGPGLL
jgi:hypothetical protein